MLNNDINEPWYKMLESNFGYHYCVEAGYFEEDLPWIESYSTVFKLPESTNVIQYSGAFNPFHQGHLEIIKSAIDHVADTNENFGTIIIHVDHNSYRTSKGYYDESLFLQSFKLLDDFFPYRGWKHQIIFEDDAPFSCSRNFTRLYSELCCWNDKVWFLCGGDRANYALTFSDLGACIVSGRSDSEKYKHYKNILNRPNIIFIEGNNGISSTKVRQSNLLNK